MPDLAGAVAAEIRRECQLQVGTLQIYRIVSITALRAESRQSPSGIPSEAHERIGSPVSASPRPAAPRGRRVRYREVWDAGAMAGMGALRPELADPE